MRKILALFAVLLTLFLLRQALIPLGTGLIFAYVLDPFVCSLERRLKGKRLLCVFIAYIVLTAAFFSLSIAFTHMIAGSLGSSDIKSVLDAFEVYYLSHKDLIHQIFPTTYDADSIGLLIHTVGRNMIHVVIGAVIGVYLLKDKEFFLRCGTQTLHLFLNQKTHGIVRELCFEINQVLSSFIRGIFVDSVIVAFLASVALSILNLDSAVLIGCFAGIANIIPYFGPIIGIIPAIIAALGNGGIPKALLAAGALLLIQQIECNLIYPRIIGHSTGLHPLFVLLAVSIASYYGGLPSMISAVPLAGIIKVLVCAWAYAQ